MKDPWLRLIVGGAVAFALFVVLLADRVDAQDNEPPGRWVYVGQTWDGLMRCESAPSRLQPLANTDRQRSQEVRVDQTGGAGERTGFQFMRATADSIYRHMGHPHRVGRDPWTLTLANQLRMAEWLLTHEGRYQWSCQHAMGQGDGWIYVTGEHHLPANPARCSANLQQRHDIARRVARSVCNDTTNRNE